MFKLLEEITVWVYLNLILLCLSLIGNWVFLKDKKTILKELDKRTEAYTETLETRRKLIESVLKEKKAITKEKDDLIKEKDDLIEKYKQNPDGNLLIINELMAEKKVILKVERVDPNEIYLRSPREVSR